MRTSSAAFIFAIAALSASGCRPKPEPAWGTWWTPSASTADRTEIQKAGLQAVKAAPEFVARTYFPPEIRVDVEPKIAAPLRRLELALANEPRISFRSEGPFEPRTELLGLRLLSRALEWRIEDAIRTKTWSEAVRRTLELHRLGNALSEGAAVQQSLGIALLDESRKALAPHLVELPAADLARLAEGLFHVLAKRPSVEIALDHEREEMLAAVMWLQDAYRRNDFASLERELGATGQRTVDHMRRLEPAERVAFFEGLARAAEQAYQDALRESRQEPAIKHSEEIERPWRGLERHFFTGPQAIVDRERLALARTRLFGISAWARGVALRTGKAPTNLRSLSENVRTDPFSGSDFGYTGSGVDFEVHSIGQDRRDDLGKSDENFLAPDIVLEEGPS